MIIGLDFDNTIVNYDEVFHTAALELELIDKNVEQTKLGVRSALRQQDKEDDWTELQGFVYGRRMNKANMFDGVKQFIRKAKQADYKCLIISHKTRYPYAGPQYDLHEAASAWIEANLVDEDGVPLFQPDEISFHETKEAKISRIGQENCDFFIDDLPEIILHETFPPTTKPVLFDPDRQHTTISGVTCVRSWDEFGGLLEE